MRATRTLSSTSTARPPSKAAPTSSKTFPGSDAGRRPGSDPLLPDGDELRALACERFADPAAVALAQLHARELRHQVELRRPNVAEGSRRVLERAVRTAAVVMRDQPLVRDVVLVDADVPLAEAEDAELFTAKIGKADLDHEAATCIE